MRKDIHPESKIILASCSCGNKINIFSTLCKNISLDICNLCHPFYTGKNRKIENKGRLEKFNKKFSNFIN